LNGTIKKYLDLNGLYGTFFWLEESLGSGAPSEVMYAPKIWL